MGVACGVGWSAVCAERWIARRRDQRTTSAHTQRMRIAATKLHSRCHGSIGAKFPVGRGRSISVNGPARMNVGVMRVLS